MSTSDEDLKEYIESLEGRINELEKQQQPAQPWFDVELPQFSRRQMLLAALGLGGLGLSSQSAGASHVPGNTCRWEMNVDAQDHGIYHLGLLHGTPTNDKELVNLEGDNLEIDGSGVLNASGGGGGGDGASKTTARRYGILGGA